MKKIILQVALPVLMCAVFSSCININSLNKVEREYSSGSLLEQDEDDCCAGSVKTELYFGLLKPDGTTVSEEEWDVFVEKAISPIFEGFTVIDAFGQCKNADGKIIREQTKLVIIVQGDGGEDKAERVKKDFKKAFPKNAFFKVSYKVLSSLDEDDGDDCGCNTDDGD
ncbi:MAG: DUF3574 domain-containing protein [Victivallales bacterium]